MESSRVLVLQDVIASLMAETGTSEALCRSFVGEMFALVAERLLEGEAVEIKGVGRFDVVDGVVRFAADADVAAAINSAFDCFEAIELADDYDGEVQAEESAADAADEQAPAEETPDETPAEEPQTEERVDEIKEDEPVADDPAADSAVDESVDQSDEKSEEAEKTEDEADAEEPVEAVEPRRRWRFVWGFLSGFLTAAVLAAVAYFFVSGLQKAPAAPAVDHAADSTTAAADATAADDSADVKTVEPEPVAKPEADAPVASKEQVFKVTNTAYLSNISRKFYGHYAFWVYIYLENKDVIKDPDNLPVGAELRIPAPEKYGINKDDPESVRRAEIKALEVKNGK